MASKEQWKAWYAKNKDKTTANGERWRRAHPEYYAEYQRKRMQKIRSAIAEYKLERGCALCGFKGHPDALQFDHLPDADKAGNVSGMTNHGREKLTAEMKKCQILCANCHAIITAERRREARQIKRQAKKDDQLRLHLA